jgi:hypothetical protein
MRRRVHLGPGGAVPQAAAGVGQALGGVGQGVDQVAGQAAGGIGNAAGGAAGQLGQETGQLAGQAGQQVTAVPQQGAGAAAVGASGSGGSSSGSRKRASGKTKRGTKRGSLALRLDEEIGLGLGHEGEEPKLVQRLRKSQEEVSEPAFVLRARMHAEELEWLEPGEAGLELEGDAVEAERHETRAGLPPRAEVSVRYRDDDRAIRARDNSAERLLSRGHNVRSVRCDEGATPEVLDRRAPECGPDVHPADRLEKRRWGRGGLSGGLSCCG